MCVEINHLLACGHYNDDFEQPYEVQECIYPSLHPGEKRHWDRVNGPHRILMDPVQSFDYDYSAICEDCREKENERLARGELLKWPNARGTV